MAANKFATMLHRNTNRITVVLVYTVLEWILILLLLLNSLFSYLISKFADYFGLKSPCLWCSRLDHVFEPGKSGVSYRDLVCETHASEISKLGYCSKHDKLVDAQDMCEDCSSSRPDSHGKTLDIGRRIALFSWVRQKSMISRNGEKQIENGEKNYGCSCCDESLDSKFFSPYLLLKPSWGVLDYAQKANLITSAIGADNDGGDYSDPCKSDCSTDQHEMENKRGVDGDEDCFDDVGTEDEHHIPFDVDECVQSRDEAEEDCSQCREIVGDGEEKMSTVAMTEEEPFEEVESKDKIEVCSRTDASVEILPLRLENPGDVDDHRLLPIELIDSMTAKNQRVSSCRKEDLNKPENLTDAQFKFIATQFDFILERGNISEAAEPVPSADENAISTKLESMDSVLHVEKHKEEEGFEASAGKESDDHPASEAVSEMLGHHIGSKILEVTEESSDMPQDLEFVPSLILEVTEEPSAQALEFVPSLPYLQENRYSMTHDDSRNSNQCDTSMVEKDQGTKQAEDATMEDRSTSFDRSEQDINHQLSLCLEINEIDKERAPETPTYMEGLHNLHKKILLQEKKEFVAEESLDGSVVSEPEGGDEVLTIERVKSALRAERKALTALYAELEEERSSSAIAANQTMAMITRLQEEKAAMQMEALQYQRMMEEQSEYDQEALQLLNELMVKREKEKQELEKELEIYRKKVLDYEAREKRMMRGRKDSNGQSRTSSPYSSNAEDSDELSVDLNHEVRDEDGFYSHQESGNSNHYTPPDTVLDLENVGLECAKHLTTLNDSLGDFEEERLSILEQLKVLEEKLFTLEDDEEQLFEDIKPMGHIPEQNGKELNENLVLSHQEVNGVVNGFSEDSDIKHYKERRTMSAKGKSLLPLFDVIGAENEDGIVNEEIAGFNGVLVHDSPVSNFTLDNKRAAVEEEVDHLYERLQALEADREFLKHCMSSLKKGDKGMDLLQEILQHLRDLRSVELRARNMDDGALA
ncbi:myosin-binding protein 2-like isoform X2 [Macadamia integrifolia]|uniref:myosin-binding protein 2-like isoform X2 n=1 Tax=Macadamia integrifolia TaxID=60698 RepID=UPI001C4F23B0|nr:myosin-binding protein 2-like isoform X2 [Macadamia integrifolia]